MFRAIITFGFAILVANFAFAERGPLDAAVRNSAQFEKVTADFTARGGWINCGTIVSLGSGQSVLDISSYCAADYNDGAGMIQLLMQGKVQKNDQGSFKVLELKLFK
jgi:hypothetical protein